MRKYNHPRFDHSLKMIHHVRTRRRRHLFR